MSADGLRIGDAEREQAQTTLNDHYAAGRLDHDEYLQRLDRIWAARTRDELAPVFGDLPRTPSTAAGPTGSSAYSTAASRRPSTPTRPRGPRVPVPLLVVLIVLGAVTVLSKLPIILVGLGIWFFFLRGGSGSGCGSAKRMHHARW